MSQKGNALFVQDIFHVMAQMAQIVLYNVFQRHRFFLPDTAWRGFSSSWNAFDYMAQMMVIRDPECN